MAGYTNNYGSGYDGGSGGNPPEYSDKPNADSINGTYGTNTPAAQTNQQTQKAGSGGGSTTPNNPYDAYLEASKGWWNAPAPAPAPAPSNPGGPALDPGIYNPPNVAPVAPAQPMPAPVSNVPPAQPRPAPAPVAPAPIPDQSSWLGQVLRDPSINTAPSTATIGPGEDGGTLTAAPTNNDRINTLPATVPSGINTLPATIPPLPVDSSHPLHPEYQALATAGDNYSAPDDGNGGTSGQLPVTPGAGISASGPVATDPTTTKLPADDSVPVKPSVPGRGHAAGSGNTTPVDQNPAPLDYSADNPPPKPPGTEDPAVAADWYRKFAFLDPSFAKVTTADVNAYRSNPLGMEFKDWYLAGHRAGEATPSDPNAGNGPGNGYTGGNKDPWGFGGYNGGSGNNVGGPAPAPTPGTGNGNGTGAATPPPATTPPPGAGTPPPFASDPNADGTVTSRVQHMYDPLFKQQRNDLARILRAQGALTGAVNSGGFNESFGRAEGSLVANQGAQLAGLTEAERNRNQAMTIAVMNDATQRFGIKTNDDLQRWLNDPNNNTLQKYGIDKNDLLERYKAELGVRSAETMAGASFNAAALQAATQKAIAEGNNATQLALGTKQNELGWGQLQGNLYNEDQNRRVTEIQMLINAGITPALAAQIAAQFGPAAPAYKP